MVVIEIILTAMNFGLVVYWFHQWKLQREENVTYLYKMNCLMEEGILKQAERKLYEQN